VARVADVVVLLLLSYTETTRARAGDATAPWLRWPTARGSNACLDAGAFADKVERSLGRSPTVAANDARVTVAARIERVAGPSPGTATRWWGEIQVRGGDGAVRGTRSIDREDASCQPLADALALATALVLSADGAVPPPPVAASTTTLEAGPSSPSTPEPASKPAAVSPALLTARPRAAPVESARVETVPRARVPRSWKLGVEGGIAFGVGLLPEPSLGARASVFLQLQRGTKIFAAASAWSQQTSSIGAGRGAALSLAWVGLGACPLNGDWRAFAWRACARGDVGRLRVLGFGFTLSTSQDRVTGDAAAGVGVERRLVGPLYAGAATELIVPLIRDRIAYSGASGEVVPIFRPAPVAGIGELHLACVF
jgi:hypothetical protein